MKQFSENEAYLTAQRYGGKPLIGNSDDVHLAENIRAKKLLEIKSVNDAMLVCDPYFLMNKSSFWIQNQHRKASEFPRFYKNCFSLMVVASKGPLVIGTQEHADALQTQDTLFKSWCIPAENAFVH